MGSTPGLMGSTLTSQPRLQNNTISNIGLIRASMAAHSGAVAAEQVACHRSARYDLYVQTVGLFQLIAAEMLGSLNKLSIVSFSKPSQKVASVL